MGGMWVVSAKRVHSKSSSREAYGTSGTGGNCGFLEQAAIFKDRFTNSGGILCKLYLVSHMLDMPGMSHMSKYLLRLMDWQPASEPLTRE